MAFLGAFVGAFVCARDCAKAKKVDEVGNVSAVGKETQRQVVTRSCAKWLRVFAPNGPTYVRYCAIKTADAPQGL